jgi:hypothetical protein
VDHGFRDRSGRTARRRLILFCRPVRGGVFLSQFSLEHPLMMNLFMLLVAAAGTSSLGACSHIAAQPQAEHQLIVVHARKGEQGDFRICDDGRVLVYPASHPKSCT